MSLEYRPCTKHDVKQVVPLMYSAGPEAFRYVFSVKEKEQVLDFLSVAFCAGDGEFGYKSHQVAVQNGAIVALVGRRTGEENLAYTWSAIKQIFSYYGFYNGIRVLNRGLKFERIVKPPAKNVVCLHNLAVAEGLRGQGVGQGIIQHFIEQEKQHQIQAKQHKFSAICLDVAETNPRAKALYQRLGFEVKRFALGRLTNRFGTGVSHEYMELKL